jgi:hypothetical protein
LGYDHGMIWNIAAYFSWNAKLRLLPLMCLPIVGIGLGAGGGVHSSRADDGGVSASPLMLERDIVPILRAYCWKCHGVRVELRV